MATFKVGQRVKRARHGIANVPVGSIGTVTRRSNEEDTGVKWDSWNDGITEYFLTHTLEPLTDPGADAFIERIKRLKPYDEPVAPKKIDVPQFNSCSTASAIRRGNSLNRTRTDKETRHAIRRTAAGNWDREVQEVRGRHSRRVPEKHSSVQGQFLLG